MLSKQISLAAESAKTSQLVPCGDDLIACRLHVKNSLRPLAELDIYVKINKQVHVQYSCVHFFSQGFVHVFNINNAVIPGRNGGYCTSDC